jgi:hypothetical protein
MFGRTYALCCINSGLVMWLKISWKHMFVRNYAASVGGLVMWLKTCWKHMFARNYAASLAASAAQNMLETYV